MKIWILSLLLVVCLVIICILLYKHIKKSDDQTESTSPQPEEEKKTNTPPKSPREDEERREILLELNEKLRTILDNRKQGIPEGNGDLDGGVRLLERYFEINERIVANQNDLKKVIGEIEKKGSDEEIKTLEARKQELLDAIKREESDCKLVIFDIQNVVEEFEYKRERKGIINQSVNCFASSLFQCLNTLDTLRRYLSSEPPVMNTVTSAVKRILADLNEPFYSTISILKDVNIIIDSPVNTSKTLLEKGSMNDVADLYEAILSSLIVERSGAEYDFSIFQDDRFFKSEDFVSIDLIESFVIRQRPIVDEDEDDSYLRYLTVTYTEERGIQEYIDDILAINNFLDFKCRVLAIVIDNSVYKKNKVRVPEKVEIRGQAFHLRSFCVNRGGERGHYIAMVRDDDKFVEFNDSTITEHQADYNKSQGRVRLLFYELND